MLPTLRRLVVVAAYFSLLVLASDGASLYEYPQYMALDTQPADRVQAGTQTLAQLMGLPPTVTNTKNGKEFHDAPVMSDSSNRLVVPGGPPAVPPSAYVPQRYDVLSPEERYVRDFFLHPQSPAGAADFGDGDIKGLNAILKGMYRQDPSTPARGSTRVNDWDVLQNLQQHMKPNRLSSPQLQQSQSRFFSSSVDVDEPRVAVKRWWGGYHRPRQQKDRRASQSKHYDCLKSCIKEGKLHPIQCHTLC
ncbi:uncharacterized protein LOC122249293 [Penaeus japonicus]|uniref:uncharacterized protein LOC122249293 n=1 Tax=Penaeus japonicus TaxID=27405 RepID=UPI001C71543C|nr:uncharacterized protein LOC122249293 [Penaeus japonicus]